MTKEEVLKACINKELEKYGISYEYVKFFPPANEVKWYQYYTFDTPEEYDNWKKFCINLFRKELKMSKKVAEEQFMWLDLNYGLKQTYL